MNIFGVLFSLITASVLFAVPRRWAPLPLLMGATYMPVLQEIAIGPFHFTVVRILIAAGFLRVAAKGERFAGKLNRLDWAMIMWAFTMVGSSVFHKDVSATIIFRLGVVFDCWGVYMLFRIFLQEPEDLRRVCRMVCLLLLPVAMSMLLEKFTGHNLFAILFGDSADAEYRQGSYRARGPFVHAILAGTIGAACLPMAIYLWAKERKIALIGLASAGGVVFASGSSGPVMTTLTIIAAIALWWQRRYLGAVIWSGLILIFGLSLVMHDPVWYLMARIDITGGSTGYFRAALIQSCIDHYSEWWFAGTDFTRHWMASGIPANENHTDIVNYYIAMGVMGGILLLLLFVWIFIVSFSYVGKALRRTRHAPRQDQFLIWILGATLFGHVTTFFSISYFAQATVFLYLLLAVIGSLETMWPAQSAVSSSVRRRPILARQPVSGLPDPLS